MPGANQLQVPREYGEGVEEWHSPSSQCHSVMMPTADRQDASAEMEATMYVIRRVYEVKPGMARRYATIAMKISGAYEAEGQRS